MALGVLNSSLLPSAKDKLVQLFKRMHIRHSDLNEAKLTVVKDGTHQASWVLLSGCDHDPEVHMSFVPMVGPVSLAQV